MSFKLIMKQKNAPSFQALMEDHFDVAFELICLASNNRKKVCGVPYSFLSLKKFDERKTHKTLALMLDPRF